jgi:DNA-binding transcriptional LysR family regulator
VELRHLRYFVAVAEELHFRRAAERLYVAQPAVSEQIRKLEAELGVRLFDRTHRSVSLTDAGRAMLVEARRVLHLAEAAQLAARNASAGAGTRLQIGYVPDALPGTVVRALQSLGSAAPRVEVSFETGAALELIESVRDRRLDAAIVGLPAPAKGLTVTTLGNQPLVVALPASVRGDYSDGVTLEELQPERIVMLPREASPALHDAILSLARSAGQAPSFIEAAEPRVEAVLLAVAAGGGAAILPAPVAERYAIPGIRLADLDGAEPVESAVLTLPETDSLATQAFLSSLERTTRAPRPQQIPARLHVAA